MNESAKNILGYLIGFTKLFIEKTETNKVSQIFLSDIFSITLFQLPKSLDKTKKTEMTEKVKVMINQIYSEWDVTFVFPNHFITATPVLSARSGDDEEENPKSILSTNVNQSDSDHSKQEEEES